jgi:hypothetical protein
LSDLSVVAEHWPVVAALLAARQGLIALVVGVGLKTDDPERRNIALAMLRVLKPGILPRKSDAGSS